MNFLTADYKIREVRGKLDDSVQDLMAQRHDFNELKLVDFEELFELRKKIISLGARIKSDLRNRKYEVLDKKIINKLDIDIISKIDTTSAYVWMSMNEFKEERQRIKSASASILCTPLDLRIYFDIGGKAYQVRNKYYNFLKSDYFTKFKKTIDLKDIEVFDIDWYSFLFNKKPLEKLKNEEMNERIDRAKKKLKEYDENDIISWNRVLCGYIIKRGKISYQEIIRKLDVIVEFYYYFEHYPGA